MAGKQGPPDDSVAAAARGGFFGIAGSMAGRLLALLLQVLVARAFGPVFFGAYATALMAVQLLQVVAGLGLEKGAPIYFARAVRTDAGSGLGELLRVALLGPALAGLIIGVCVWWLAEPLAQKLGNPTLAECLRPMAFAAGWIGLTRVLAGASRGFCTARYAVLIEDILPGTLQVLFFLVFWVAGMGEASAPSSYAWAGFVCAIAGWYLVRRQTSAFEPAARGVPGVGRGGEMLRFSLPVMPMGLLVVAAGFADLFVLNLRGSPEEVGAYAPAARLIFLFALLTRPFEVMFTPLMAGDYHAGRGERVGSLLRTGVLWTLLITAPVFVFILVARAPLIAMFGPAFGPSTELALVILAGGCISGAMTSICGNLLIISGHQGRELACLVASLLLVVALCFLLVPRFGVVGAAVGMTLGRLMTDALRVAVLWKTLRLHPGSRHLALAVLLLVMGAAAGIAVSPLVADSGWLALLTGTGLAAGLALLLFCYALDKTDRSMVWGAIRRQLGKRISP